VVTIPASPPPDLDRDDANDLDTFAALTRARLDTDEHGTWLD
jgi:hypothetical protein